MFFMLLGIEGAGCQSYATFFQGRFHHLFNYLFYSIQYYLSIFVKLSKVVVFPEVTIKTLRVKFLKSMSWLSQYKTKLERQSLSRWWLP